MIKILNIKVPKFNFFEGSMPFRDGEEDEIKLSKEKQKEKDKKKSKQIKT